MGSEYKQNTEVMETCKVGPALKTQQDKKKKRVLDEGPADVCELATPRDLFRPLFDSKREGELYTDPAQR